ncbi:CdaR family protein [Staphylospora marina]|uniref:CdaR family protein n=1 Tax=Staphylospora marina TaxID=2490858 RepID=UPI000F5BC80D|nr:CdaR family protein [Staphylospora marina]
MNEWMKNEMVLRLVSLCIAVLMWVSVTQPSLTSGKPEFSTRIRNVSVEVSYDKERFELAEEVDKVELVLYGEESALEHLTLGYRLWVDATGAGEGTHRLPVRVEGLPREVTYRVEPSAVDVTLEAKVTKEMEPVIDVVGDLPDDYKVGSPDIKPDKVVVRGSQKLLGQVQSVRGTVYLDTTTLTTSKQVRLQAYGEKGPLAGVEVLPRSVQVKIPVDVPSKVVPLQVTINEWPPPWMAVEQVSVRPERVKVYGTGDFIGKLRQLPGPALDLTGVTKDRTWTVPVPIHEDAIKVEPQQVEIYVKMVRANTKNVKDIPLRVEGLVAGRRATILSPASQRFDILISGAPKLLERIRPEDVEAVVDVSRLSPGEHEVPVKITLPDWIRSAESKTWKARVKIE